MGAVILDEIWEHSIPEVDFELRLSTAYISKFGLWDKKILPREAEALQMMCRIRELLQCIHSAHYNFEKLVEFSEKTLLADLAPYIEAEKKNAKSVKTEKI